MSAGPSNGSQASLPPADDFEVTWAFLEDGIDLLLNRFEEGLTPTKYMHYYTGVYNFCTNRGKQSYPGQKYGQVNLGGEELYHRLKICLERHCRGLLERIRTRGDDVPILESYNKEWKSYTVGTRYLHNIFRYLNKYWIKREVEVPKKDPIYEVYRLSLVIWKSCVYSKVNADIATAVLAQIRRERDGRPIDTALLKSVIGSFVALGHDPTSAKGTSLAVYKADFERSFLEVSHNYYRDESAYYVSANPVTDYLRKVESRLQEEKDRVVMYLHSETLKPLVKTCQKVLIEEHQELFRNEFQNLLRQEMEEDLVRMYNLLDQIPNGLKPLREQFEDYVKKEGLLHVSKTAAEGQEPDSKVYVEAILDIHRRYLTVVDKAFQSEPGFMGSLDRACREFINRNSVSKNTSKSPEFLAKFCDTMLRKSVRAEEQDVERILDQIMVVFKYLEDKDVFQKFYSKNLAKRLVQSSSASEDAEESMIAKLKEACGFEYTNKLQRMFTDIGISRDLNQQFHDKMSQTHDDVDLVDFTVMVLGAGFWPLNPPGTPFTVPQELIQTYDRFQRYYQNKHSGRKLTWLMQLSKGEVKANYLRRMERTGAQFQVSTYQMGILLQYNASTVFTFDELAANTGLDKEPLTNNLMTLIKAKVLLQEGDRYILNEDFKVNKIRINLNVPIKTEQRQEDVDVHKTIDEDRKILLQAAVVRIMKARKTLRHVALVQETIAQVQVRFKPKIGDIKKAIDTLLDKEYIRRVEGNVEAQTYEYLA